MLAREGITSRRRGYLYDRGALVQVALIGYLQAGLRVCSPIAATNEQQEYWRLKPNGKSVNLPYEENLSGEKHEPDQ